MSSSPLGVKCENMCSPGVHVRNIEAVHDLSGSPDVGRIFSQLERAQPSLGDLRTPSTGQANFRHLQVFFQA